MHAACLSHLVVRCWGDPEGSSRDQGTCGDMGEAWGIVVYQLLLVHPDIFNSPSPYEHKPVLPLSGPSVRSSYAGCDGHSGQV